MEIDRLGGRIPDDFAPRPWAVPTPAGMHPVPPSVQAFLAVQWPSDQHLVWDDASAGGIDFHDSLVEVGLVVEDRPRPWFAIGLAEHQWYLVVDLAEAAGNDDPVTYRVDHEGGEPAPAGRHLSWRLEDLSASSPAIEFARACARGNLSDVRAALQRGADTGPLDPSGLTPLHLAVTAGSVKVVRALLDAGADPNAGLETRVSDGAQATYLGDKNAFFDPPYWWYSDETPLHMVLAHFLPDGRPAQAPAIVKALLDAGADPNRTTPNADRRNEAEPWSPTDRAYGHTLGANPCRAPELDECLRLLYQAGGRLVEYAPGWEDRPWP